MISPGTLKIETPREDRALVVGFELYRIITTPFGRKVGLGQRWFPWPKH